MKPIMDDHQLSELITAADLPPADTDAAITELGAAAVAERF